MVKTQRRAVHAVFAIDDFATRGGFTAYILTVHYMLAFAIGAVLACHREILRTAYTALPARTRVLLGVLTLALYVYGPKAMHVTGLKTIMPYDWPLMAGAALLLTIAAFEARIAGWPNRAPLRYLGRISYSLYLFHPLVLLAALHAFYGRVPLGPLLLVSFIATFVVSDLAYRAIERPTVGLSRWSSQRTAALYQALATGRRAGR